MRNKSHETPQNQGDCRKGIANSTICIDGQTRRVTTLTPIVLTSKKLGILFKERVLTKEELPLEFFWPITILVIGFLFAFTLVALWMGLFLKRDVRQPLLSLTETLAPILADQKGGKFPHFKVTEIEKLATQVAELVKDFEERQVNAAIAETTQMLAHDVKRPFVVFSTGLAAIGDERDPTRVKELVATLIPDVEKALHNVEGLVADIREVSTKTLPQLEVVAVEDLIESSLDQVFKSQPAMSIELNYRWNHSHKVMADIVRSPRIFSNLIENAVEAMRGEGEIRFATKEIHSDGSSFIQITIGNTNAEIASEDIPKVFDKFFTKGKRRGGTGLGLTIVKKLVSEHGGKVWCESNPNSGVEFHFALPMAEAKTDPSMTQLPKNSAQIGGRRNG